LYLLRKDLKMTKQQATRWIYLRENNIFKMLDDLEYEELIRLNHLVMEESHKIHNNNMLGEKK